MKKILFFLPILLFLSSCAKDSQSELKDVREKMLVQQRGMLPTQAEMLAEVLVPVDGYVILQSFSTVTSTSLGNGRPGNVNAYITNHSEEYKDFGKIELGGHELSLREDKSYTTGINSTVDIGTLYGESHTLSIAGKGNPSYLADVYIPKAIHVLSSDVDEIKEGATITWETDPANRLGVGILIEYGKHFEYKKPIHTEDDGSYTLTKEDVEDVIAQGQNYHVNVSLGRGSYQRLVSKSEPTHSIAFISFSVVSMDWYVP